MNCFCDLYATHRVIYILLRVKKLCSVGDSIVVLFFYCDIFQ